jgi:hypothetical protein
MIDPNDARLSQGERRYLLTIAKKLKDKPRIPSLPDQYKAEIDRVFGSCSDGDLEARGEE